MRTRSSIILAIAALVVGMVIGGVGGGLVFWRFVGQVFTKSSAEDACTSVLLLKQMRAGETTNAVAVLEARLDGDLITVGSSFENPRDLKRDPFSLKTLQKARDYRIQFPHKSGSQAVDEGTAKAFSLLDAQGGK